MSELTIDPTIVIPGDEITPKITPKTTNESSKVIIGPGLRREDKDLIVAVKCGQLVNRKNMIYWIDSRQKRYIACKGDRVIGFVTNKGSLSARLDIGTNETATLSLLAFPNATKRNKPAIEVGDAVFAQILTSCKDMESELVCVNSLGKKDGLGVLSNTGYVLTVPINIIRRILAPDSKLLECLGKKFKYEIAVGMNGRIWINSKSIETTITVVNILSQLENTPKSQYQQICDQIMEGWTQKHKK